jgi:tetratricopeptide (TPR) repeat protein
MQAYPCGPAVAKWLGIRSEENKNLTSEDKTKFQEFLLRSVEEKNIEDIEQFSQILDELLAMDFPLLVLKVADCFPSLRSIDHFKALRAQGIAGMLTGEYSLASFAFEKAISLAPEEISSYVNLFQVQRAQEDMDAAKDTLERALNIDPNYFPVWDLLYQFFTEFFPKPITLIKQTVQDYDSWMGALLLCELEGLDKVEELEKFYQKGERSQAFLAEYTGALGEKEQYEKVNEVVWQCESFFDKKLHWKLNMHRLQATIALGQNERFLELKKEILKAPDLPKLAREEIENLTESM